MANSIISFLHDGSIGDVWAALPVIKENYIRTNRKGVLYLREGQRGIYYEGATHPTRNEDGEQVMLNKTVIDMMIPLLKSQDYIEDARVYSGEVIDVDFNRIRETYVGMPNFTLSMWYFFCWPDAYPDITKSWVDIPDSNFDLAKGKILINRTERYLNPLVDYSFIKEYEDDCLFVGTMKEYNLFCINNGIEIKKLSVSNFLEYAQAIKQSKFYLSNQSQGFQIAEALKHPRICEVCGWAANVIPVGENSYAFLNQMGLEYNFHKLNGTAPSYIEKRKKAAIAALK